MCPHAYCYKSKYPTLQGPDQDLPHSATLPTKVVVQQTKSTELEERTFVLLISFLPEKLKQLTSELENRLEQTERQTRLLSRRVVGYFFPLLQLWRPFITIMSI